MIVDNTHFSRPLHRFGFLVLSDFPMLSLASAIEVLRVANQVIGHEQYSWSIITPNGSTALSIDGATHVRSVPYSAAPPLDLMLVCGGPEVDQFVTDDVVSLVHELDHQQLALGGLSAGTYALIKAGLMDGYNCVIEWSDLPALRSAHPNVQFQSTKFVIDRDRVASIGGTAPIALMLALIRCRLGDSIISSISNALAIQDDAAADTAQQSRLESSLTSAVIAKVVSLMEARLEEPLTVSQLAQLTGVSVRRMQRLFQEAYGTTPTAYYLYLRLRRARELILNSTLSISDISFCCGFESPSHFSRTYRAKYGRTPRSERFT